MRHTYETCTVCTYVCMYVLYFRISLERKMGSLKKYWSAMGYNGYLAGLCAVMK